jgi:neuronal growth regulator 1
VIVNSNIFPCNLQILNIEFSDTAIYECQVIESATVKHTANVELLVKHVPKVDNIEITPSSVAVNGSAQLKCLASGYPRPSIIWRRDNDAIMPGGGNSYTYVL